MRIWSLHPKYLDQKGLVAVWRETLLAQKVLRGLTKGYTQHPQLERFKSQKDPIAAIAAYLHGICDEADARGYTFDRSRIAVGHALACPLKVTRGQLDYEWQHLLAKLSDRDPKRYESLKTISTPLAHPIFTVIEGPVEPWEKRVAV